jgi:hypothetical protein
MGGVFDGKTETWAYESLKYSIKKSSVKITLVFILSVFDW